MDSLTHIAIGACIGDLAAGRRLGKKAMVLGAIAQSLPDIDFVASSWLPVHSDLLAHRGFTHSLLFAELATALLALICERIFRKSGISLVKWAFFWIINLLIHLFLDCFNVYGTGLFEPFSHYRVSFNTLYVLDPLFSIWPVIALVVLVVLSRDSRRRTRTAHAALLISACYLLYSCVNKIMVTRQVRVAFEKQHIAAGRFFTTPTSLNNLLWYVVAENDTGYNIGYRSLLDRPDTIAFHSVARNAGLLRRATDSAELNDLLRFSQGYYTVELRHDTVVFNDLRFGELASWRGEPQGFMCYYYLQCPGANNMIVQRGRMARWNREMLGAFISRIKGR